jgi:hypothetical protein
MDFAIFKVKIHIHQGLDARESFMDALHGDERGIAVGFWHVHPPALVI